MNRHTIIISGLFLLICTFIVVPLFQDGMFMDAVQYTAVAHNMSQGYGTFWHPEFSMRGVSNYDGFYEQPPLGIFLLSVFYRLCGDSLYVERIFILICLIATLLLIRAIWRYIFKSQSSEKNFWPLPILLFCITPIIIWTYDSFMLENIMIIWILAAVFLLLKNADNFKLYNVVLAAIFIFLASFTKGIPGLFPLIMPVIQCMLGMQNWKKALISVGIIMATLTGIYLVIFSIPEAQTFYDYYLFDRTTYRINSMPTVTYRGYIFTRLLLELLPAAGITGLLILINRRKAAIDKKTLRIGMLFIFLGLAGSLPLMLTMIQKGFYLVPCFPFFAIGLSLFILGFQKPKVELTPSKTVKIVRYIVLGTLSITFIFNLTKLGTPNRDNDLLSDLKTLSPYIEKEEIIYSPNAMWNNWAMQSYLMRYYNKSMDEGFNGNIVIVDRTIPVDIPPQYQIIPAKTKRYDIYSMVMTN